MNLDKYRHIPYADHGRGFDGCDCWGLVRLFYREELRIELPSWSAAYPSADSVSAGHIATQAECFADWLKLAAPEIGAVGEFHIGGLFHVGVCLDTFGRRMLHIMRGRRVTIENVSGHAWKHRCRGWYRYAG